MVTVITGQKVIVQNVTSVWNGRIGIVDRWVNSNWYVVNVDGTELVLDASRGEIIPYKEEE